MVRPETQELVNRMLGASTREGQDKARLDAREALRGPDLPEEDKLQIATAGECLVMTIEARDHVGWEERALTARAEDMGREELGGRMLSARTPAEIREAQALAHAWLAAHPDDEEGRHYVMTAGEQLEMMRLAAQAQEDLREQD